MTYDFLEHTADVKFRASGRTMEEMFISAAEALNETIKGNISVLEQEEKNIEVEATDKEALLHDFLEEFLYLLDSEDFLLSKIRHLEYDKEKLKIKAKIFGDKAEHYKFTNDVKAITYNEIYIKEEQGQFNCQIVLDV